MLKKKAKTCFIYVRVSTKMQVDKGESIEAQLYELREYARRNGLKIIHEFVEGGHSGKNIAGRPRFREMLQEIQAGAGVNYVLVFKLSRFGRNAADSLNSLQLMQDYGTNLVCIKDGINSEAQMGKMMIAFMSAFAEMERENILIQTMAGREQKAREGRWNGGQAPYGYYLVKDEKGKGHLMVDEEEAKIVRLIFEQFVEKDKGVNSLSSWLNTYGYRRKPRGNAKYEHFTPEFIKKVIDNPIYAGKIAFGRRRVEPVEGRRNEYHVVKQNEYGLYDGEHEAIIDDATWEAAQEKRKAQSKAFPRKSKFNEHEHLLTGVLVCPVCGRKMIANVSQGKRKKDGTLGKRTYAYNCKYSKRQFGPSCTFTRQYKQEMIDSEVIEIIRKVSHSKVFAERIQGELSEAVDVDKLNSELESLKKTLNNNETARRMLAQQIDRLDSSDISYERKYDDMQLRLDSLYDQGSEIEKEIENVLVKLDSVEKNRVTTERIQELLDKFEEEFEGESDEQKKSIIQSVVDTVEIHPDADPKKGEVIVDRIRFKCPIEFHDGVVESNSKFISGIFRDPPSNFVGNPYINKETVSNRVEQDNVETVCLLSNRKPDTKVRIDVDLEDYYRIKDSKKNQN